MQGKQREILEQHPLRKADIFLEEIFNLIAVILSIYQYELTLHRR